MIIWACLWLIHPRDVKGGRRPHLIWHLLGIPEAAPPALFIQGHLFTKLFFIIKEIKALIFFLYLTKSNVFFFLFPWMRIRIFPLNRLSCCLCTFLFILKIVLTHSSISLSPWLLKSGLSFFSQSSRVLKS